MSNVIKENCDNRKCCEELVSVSTTAVRDVKTVLTTSTQLVVTDVKGFRELQSARMNMLFITKLNCKSFDS